MDHTAADDISHQANAWFALFHGGAPTPEQRAAWSAWMAADVRHAQAYAELENLWAASALLLQPSPAAAPVAPARLSRRRFVGLGLAASAAAVTAGAGTLWLNGVDSPFADLRTAVGERRIAYLPDGSTVEMAGHTAMNLDFSATRRAVELLHGQAFFRVRPSAAGEFSINTQAGRLHTREGEFCVSCENDAGLVAVSQGRVQVLTAGQQTELEEGLSLSFSARATGDIQRAELAQMLAWRRIVDFVEKPADPPAMPGNAEMSLASMGIYIFSAEYLYRLLEDDAKDPDSTHDFGKDLIPRAVAENQALAHPFNLSAIATPPFSGPYWRDVGTVDAYWAANLDLASTTPALNMYDKDWPIWTYQEQLPPAKFVHDQDGRRGEAINALVSGGCIVSGSVVRESVLFSNVLVRSYSTIEQAVVLPDVQINRHCRLKKVVIDRRCTIPEGLVIGEDAEDDARRFHRTEGGVVLVTREMLDKL